MSPEERARRAGPLPFGILAVASAAVAVVVMQVPFVWPAALAPMLLAACAAVTAIRRTGHDPEEGGEMIHKERDDGEAEARRLVAQWKAYDGRRAARKRFFLLGCVLAGLGGGLGHIGWLRGSVLVMVAAGGLVVLAFVCMHLVRLSQRHEPGFPS